MSEPRRPNELPLPDYEHMPLGSLRHRIRSLSEAEVRDLIGYEDRHGQRTPVLEVLRNRLDQLRKGAEPSRGTQETQPEQTPPPEKPPITSDKTAPPAGAPPHGVPQQPGKPKGNYQPGHG